MRLIEFRWPLCQKGRQKTIFHTSYSPRRDIALHFASIWLSNVALPCIFTGALAVLCPLQKMGAGTIWKTRRDPSIQGLDIAGDHPKICGQVDPIHDKSLNLPKCNHNKFQRFSGLQNNNAKFFASEHILSLWHVTLSTNLFPILLGTEWPAICRDLYHVLLQHSVCSKKIQFFWDKLPNSWRKYSISRP